MGVHALQENYAFNKLACNDFVWCLHRSEQSKAIEVYKAPKSKEIVVRGAYKTKKIVKGMGHKEKEITFPNPKLDEGPFAGA